MKNIKVITISRLYSTAVNILKIHVKIMNSKKTIDIHDLICMSEYVNKHNYKIDLAYTKDNNLLFGERIYRKNAKLWLYKDLANIIFKAAEYCYENFGLYFILYDGLRTVEAQEKMMQTQRAIDNPQWLEPPRMLSPAGSGGHPRGMAIDIGLETFNGDMVYMGSPFDCMSEESHRDYNLSEQIQKNRAMLDKSMIEASKTLGIEIFLLPEEWWDFRLPADFYNQYKPLHDPELPEEMRMADII